jgi:hypothetical protein
MTINGFKIAYKIIVTYTSVTIDGVWIGDWIYWIFLDFNYK